MTLLKCSSSVPAHRFEINQNLRNSHCKRSAVVQVTTIKLRMAGQGIFHPHHHLQRPRLDLEDSRGLSQAVDVEGHRGIGFDLDAGGSPKDQEVVVQAGQAREGSQEKVPGIHLSLTRNVPRYRPLAGHCSSRMAQFEEKSGLLRRRTGSVQALGTSDFAQVAASATGL